jgi:subtilisin family serine protease
MNRRFILSLAAALAVAACNDQQEPSTGTANPGSSFASTAGVKGINVALKGPATPAQLAELAKYGTIKDQLTEINAVLMSGDATALKAIQALPFVASANFDASRNIPREPTVAADANFSNGLSTWDLDAINVTNFGSGRAISYDGSGVNVAVLDTGLLPGWRSYFPENRIATQYAKAFGGGGQDNGTVSTQPNKWEDDTYGHGTHVTSTVLGYDLFGTPINGVAPNVTIIPVKVLNQNGSGWSSTIAQGIVYVADLKAGELSGSPMVINMSLGGPTQDAVEKAAIDYAISKGVIVVASAGNEGTAGMGYPGAYQPVISAAASGWVNEWNCGSGYTRSWWVNCDVADPTNASDFYITDFSSRAKAGQDLDVAAPGSWVVGPFQENQGALAYFFLGGTSMASPHVAGIVALMAQKDPSLTAANAEATLESTAIPLPAGSRTITDLDGSTITQSWGSDATGAGLVVADRALGLSLTRRNR